MTKQEKIQEAYGEHYDMVKNHIDENGWIDTQTFSFSRKGIDFEQYKKRSNTYLGFYNRPKSLQGIENNNGWIKIESEEDLPESGYYEVILKGSGNDSRATLDREFNKKSQLMHYSHYQKIINTKPPLY